MPPSIEQFAAARISAIACAHTAGRILWLSRAVESELNCPAYSLAIELLAEHSMRPSDAPPIDRRKTEVVPHLRGLAATYSKAQEAFSPVKECLQVVAAERGIAILPPWTAPTAHELAIEAVRQILVQCKFAIGRDALGEGWDMGVGDVEKHYDTILAAIKAMPTLPEKALRNMIQSESTLAVARLGATLGLKDDTKNDTPKKTQKKRRLLNDEALACIRRFKQERRSDPTISMKDVVEGYVEEQGTGSARGIMRRLNDNPENWKDDTKAT